MVQQTEAQKKANEEAYEKQQIAEAEMLEKERIDAKEREKKRKEGLVKRRQDLFKQQVIESHELSFIRRGIGVADGDPIPEATLDQYKRFKTFYKQTCSNYDVRRNEIAIFLYMQDYLNAQIQQVHDSLLDKLSKKMPAKGAITNPKNEGGY